MNRANLIWLSWLPFYGDALVVAVVMLAVLLS
jgi:hypothetical protein